MAERFGPLTGALSGMLVAVVANVDRVTAAWAIDPGSHGLQALALVLICGAMIGSIVGALVDAHTR